MIVISSSDESPTASLPVKKARMEPQHSPPARVPESDVPSSSSGSESSSEIEAIAPAPQSACRWRQGRTREFLPSSSHSLLRGQAWYLLSTRSMPSC